MNQKPESGFDGKINYSTMAQVPSLSGADAEALESYRVVSHVF